MPVKRTFRRLWTGPAIRDKIRREIAIQCNAEWGWADPVPDPHSDRNGLPMRPDARENAEDFWLPEPGVLSKYRMRVDLGTEPTVTMTHYGGLRISFRRDDGTGFRLVYPCGGVMFWQQWTKTKEADGVYRYNRFTERSIDAGRRVSGLMHWLVTPIIKAGGLRDAVDLPHRTGH